MYRVPSGPDLAYSSTTLYNGADVYIKALKGGIAVTHIHDDYRRGTLKTDIVALSYAQYFSLLNNHLKIIPSIQMAYLQKELDLRKISFGELQDGGLAAQWPVMYGGGPIQNKRNADFSSGLLINYKEFYFGTSVFHLSQPNEGLLGDSRLPARLKMHTSYTNRVNLWTVVNFFAQYQLQDKFNFWQAKINFLVANHVIFGIGGHSRDAASLNLGYKNKYFTLGLGYDQSLINFSDQLNAAWELQFSLNIRKKSENNSDVPFERW